MKKNANNGTRYKFYILMDIQHSYYFKKPKKILTIIKS